MRKNKKAVMALSFCLGLTIFVSTAFADISSKSGYEQFKDSIKSSAKSLEKTKSYTSLAEIKVLDNDKVLLSTNVTSKDNKELRIMENVDITTFSNGKQIKNYSYSDKEGSISYNSTSDIYYVNKNGYSTLESKNPFEEKGAKDIEKIIDAFVGNLSDYVIVNQNTDGTKEFTGSLNEGQIPAIINAVTSFIFKQRLNSEFQIDSDILLPDLADDLFIKSVKGKASTDKEGSLQNLFATCIISGNDKEGTSHDLTLEMLIKTTDINSTTITKPDLTGKNVQTYDSKIPDDKNIAQKFEGNYKNAIVIEKDGKYAKIGERIIDLKAINDKNISVHYYEKYSKGFEQYNNNITDISFTCEIEEMISSFKCKDSKGIDKSGSIFFGYENATLSLIFNNMDRNYITSNYNSEFTRVFE